MKTFLWSKGSARLAIAGFASLVIFSAGCAPAVQPGSADPGGTAGGPFGKATVAFVPPTTGSWDPAIYGGASDTPYVEVLYDRLVEADRATLANVPGLASKWTMSPDGMTYEFEIRKRVKFHNGDEVTAEDVVFSVERSKRLSQPATRATIEATIDSMKAKDGSVVFRLKQPSWQFLSAVGGGTYSVIPKKYTEQVGDGGFTKAPVGSGPFTFVEGSKQEYLEVQAIDYEHFLRQPGVQRLRYVVVGEETTRVAMLKTGEADLAQVSSASLLSLQGDSRTRIIKAPVLGGLRLFALGQEDAQNPMSKLEVRQALSYAIDRQAIATGIYRGYASPAGTGEWNPAQPGFPEWGMKAPPYDLAKAKELLAKAGFTDAKPLKFTFQSTEYGPLPGWTQVAPVLQAMWEKAGMQVEVRNSEFGAWSAFIRENKYGEGLTVSVGTGMGGGATGAFSQVLSKTGPYRYVAGIAQGAHKEVADLYEQFLAELDDAKRAQIQDKIFVYTRDNLTTIPVIFIDGLWAAGPKLKEYVPKPGTYSIGNMYTITVQP